MVKSRERSKPVPSRLAFRDSLFPPGEKLLTAHGSDPILVDRHELGFTTRQQTRLDQMDSDRKAAYQLEVWDS